MEAVKEKTGLTNLQHEMLKLFGRDTAEEDLLEIKSLIANYFGKKAMDLADKVWEEQGWTIEDMERMLNTRMRTAYNPSKCRF